jgi:hypothetical protein
MIGPANPNDPLTFMVGGPPSTYHAFLNGKYIGQVKKTGWRTWDAKPVGQRDYLGIWAHGRREAAQCIIRPLP